MEELIPVMEGVDWWTADIIEQRMASLPPRTKITLESFDTANIGGDLLALGIQCILFIFLLLLLKVFHCKIICRRKQHLQTADSLIKICNLGKTYERR